MLQEKSLSVASLSTLYLKDFSCCIDFRFYSCTKWMKFALEQSDKLWQSPTSQCDVILLHWLPVRVWITWKGHFSLLPSSLFSAVWQNIFYCIPECELILQTPTSNAGILVDRKVYFPHFICSQLYPECPRYQMYWHKIVSALLLPASLISQRRCMLDPSLPLLHTSSSLQTRLHIWLRNLFLY